MTLSRKRHFLPGSLTARFIVFTVAIFLVLQVIQLVSFTDSVRSNARLQQKQGFDVARNVLTSQLGQRQQMLTQSAEILAADFGLREAVAGNHLRTIVSALDNHANRIGAPLAVLLSTSGSVVASTSGDNPLVNAVGSTLATLNNTKTTLFSYNDELYQLVKIPVKAPIVVGYIVMGFSVDQRVLEQFTNVSGTAAMIVHGHSGAYRVQDSTLPSIASRSTLAADLKDNETLAIESISGQTFRAVLLTTLGTPNTPVYVLLASSLEKSLAPYSAIQHQVLLLTILGGILFALISVHMVRRLTEPLRRLMASAGRITAGDLDTPIATQSTVTEIKTLSSTLESMRASVKASQETTRLLAHTDSLTSLPNRLQLLQDASLAIAALGRDQNNEGHPDTDTSVIVLMFDLQRFKNVNDVLGYDSADSMLIAVGTQTQEFCQENGLMLARISADEFAVLFPRHRIAHFEQLVQELQTRLEHPMQLLGTSVDVNTVGGFSVYPADAQSPEALLKHAEIAMYEAKRRRRHTLGFQAEMDASSQKTLSLLSELREAVVENQLRLFVQPKIDLVTRKIDSLELLVRWQHPTKGLVPPMEFIPFAEQTGFIRELTQWVFETATRQQAILVERNLDLCLSLNLSVHDLLDPLLLERFRNALAAQNVSAETFCLEITESAIMDDPARAQLLLEELRRAGFKLSIDDFGTGYSSLAYLKNLPVHELKIDRSFVMHMDTNPLDAKIVRSTIDLAHNLDLYVTAEGIENASILEALALLGCDKAQGYHICRPMAFDAFLEWIKTSPYRLVSNIQHERLIIDVT